MNIYEKVSKFYERYRGEKTVIGKSSEGRNLYAFFVGERGKPLCLSQYAIHAREYFTAYLALKHITVGVKRGGAWIIPLTNPDGALLCEEGIESVKTAWKRKLIQSVNGSSDFSLWKANAEAVDLNVNFDARWGTGKSNQTRPLPANYIGRKPFCTSETVALKNFTYLARPNCTLSWHTKGEEIYWRFHQPLFRAIRDKRISKIVSKSTGYPLKDAPYSAGGYKDWCIEKLKIPALTVETCKDSFTYPLAPTAIADMIKNCGNVLYDLSAEW